MSVAATAYYPYDSGSGANVTEAQWRNFMSRLRPSAVLANVNNELRPFGDSSGMQVKVDTGAAWVRGAYGEWTSGTTTLPIAAVGGIPGGQSRIDAIVLRNDFVANQVLLDVLTGTAGASPSVPALTQSSSMWEILVGTVPGLTNATSTIAASGVLDARWKMTEAGILYHDVSLSGTGATLPGAGSIPTGYRDLLLRVWGRTDKAAVNREAIGLRFNGDTGANYTWSALTATDSTTPAGVAPASASSIAIGNLLAATGSATVPGEIWVDIPEYANTSFVRTALARTGQNTGGSNFQVGQFFGNWNSTAALTSLALLTLSGGGFVAGSRAMLQVLP